MLGASEYPYIYVIVPSLSRLLVVDGWGGGSGSGLSAGMFMARLMQVWEYNTICPYDKTSLPLLFSYSLIPFFSSLSSRLQRIIGVIWKGMGQRGGRGREKEREKKEESLFNNRMTR